MSERRTIDDTIAERLDKIISTIRLHSSNGKDTIKKIEVTWKEIDGFYCPDVKITFWGE